MLAAPLLLLQLLNKPRALLCPTLQPHTQKHTPTQLHQHTRMYLNQELQFKQKPPQRTLEKGPIGLVAQQQQENESRHLTGLQLQRGSEKIVM